jgi:pyridinium-3,5-biscarboxylic acid mononucleotide sulfurtransferase
VSDSKLERLREILRSYGSCLVAYSGGVDSVFLAKIANDTLGASALAAIADSPSLPRRELAEALALAEQFAFPVAVIKTDEFSNPSYLANPNNRCYFCKHELFTELNPLAREKGFKTIAYGENASDVGDHRPGAKAAAEFDVRAPLKEAGLTKSEIRKLSAALGLPTADKPQMACLSSRIPYGEAVTPEKLRMIEEGEYCLKDLGFHDVRVRHHELKTAQFLLATGLGAGEPKKEAVAHLARIELGPTELARLFRDQLHPQVSEAFRQIGYHHVTVDLMGYRRGSVNEPTAQPIGLKQG